MRFLLSICAAVATVGFATASMAGDAIPYPNAGTLNPLTYSFTAQADGDVVAYFVDGASAGYDNQLGLLINGVASSAGFGLDNHTSSVGDSFILGTVHAGDTLTFVMKNLSIGASVYSDESLNAAYDSAYNPYAGPHNHIYSTPYTGNPAIGSIPVGAYVAFEDIPFGDGPDFNYVDEAFVFTNASATVTGGVPEPASWAMMLVGFGGLGATLRRRRSAVLAV